MKKRTKLAALGIVIALICVVIAVIIVKTQHDQSVVERYEDRVKVEPISSTEASTQARLDARMLVGILEEVDKLEQGMRRMNAEFLVSKNDNKGLYTVEQEMHIAGAYSQYLLLRKALFHIAFRHREFATIEDQHLQDESFLLAYAAGLTLYRNAVIFVRLFKDQPNARRKLNEANPITQTPANMFDEMYANVTSKKNVELVIDGLREFSERRERLGKLPMVEKMGNDALLNRLDTYEKELESAYDELSKGRADILWTTLKSNVQQPAYNTQTMVSMMISHLRVPLHSKGLSPKSIREDIQPLLKPGDILLTRRDGYLTNTFLPGHWGHAAMYIGTPDDLRAIGAESVIDVFQGNDKDGFPFAAIEAIGEGVRFSSAEFAMAANSLAVLRPKLSPDQIREAIVRAIQLEGTPYDFSFCLLYTSPSPRD